MRILAPILLSFALTACVSTPVKPVEHFVQVPIPFCPATDDISVPKTGGLEYITSTTPPGDVAKQYQYEIEYWKGLVDLYKKKLAFYAQNGKQIDQIKTELQQLINTAQAKDNK